MNHIPDSFDSETKRLTLELIRDLLQSQVRVPGVNEEIFGTECAVSCDSTESPSGIYVNLRSHCAYGYDYVAWDAQRSNQRLYLCIKEVPKLGHGELNSQVTEASGATLPLDKGKVNSTSFKFYIYVYPEGLYYPCGEAEDVNDSKSATALSVDYLQSLGLPLELARAVNVILSYGTSGAAAASATAWTEEVKESQHARSLVQVHDPPQVSSSDWRCRRCGKEGNQWMNLTDGYIGCGRKIYGIKESGCQDGTEGAAVVHYNETHYPLAVKLGTITPTGEADVYSYAEDAMVKDPLLEQHLKHFGLTFEKVQRSEKTTAELETLHNTTFNWSLVTEDDVELRTLRGRRHVGLANFQNTCYINSVLQLLASVPEISSACSENNIKTIYLNESQGGQWAPVHDLLLQLAKVISALSTDIYPLQREKQRHELAEQVFNELRSVGTHGDVDLAVETTCKRKALETVLASDYNFDWVAPRMFRNIVGKGHPEFSTTRQQDAEEFLRYIFTQFSAYAPKHSRFPYSYMLSPTAPGSMRMQMQSVFDDCFAYQTEEILECLSSQRKRFTSLSDWFLSVPVVPPPALLSEAAFSNNVSSTTTTTTTAIPGPDGTPVQIELTNEEGYGSKKVKHAELSNLEATESKIEFSLKSCLDNWAAGEVFEFKSPVTHQLGPGRRFTRFGTFPKYLLLQVKRFYVTRDWEPAKLHNPIDVPETLELSPYRCGVKPTDPEQLLPIDETKSTSSSSSGRPSQPPAPSSEAPEITGPKVAQLIEMGFSDNAAKRALAIVGEDVEAAVSWLFEHSEDPGINDPVVSITAAAPAVGNLSAGASRVVGTSDGGDAEGREGRGGPVVDENRFVHSSEMLLSMGFAPDQVKAALIANKLNEERALTWILTAAEDGDLAVKVQTTLEAFEHQEKMAKAQANRPFNDGAGRYQLQGFISHVGRNANSGHYVAHIREGDGWILYNDKKVAQSVHPPIKYGYLYLYRRQD